MRIIKHDKKNSWLQKNKLKPEIVEVTKFNKNYELAKQFAAFKVTKPLKLLKPKVGCFGRVVEYDGCVEHWCNKEKYYLLAAVDSFTGILLAIRFEAQETTMGYYYLSNDLFKKYGLPRQIKTDRRTTFWNDDSSNSPLPKCFRELGIGLSSSTEPTFKPNVERMFQTMQEILTIYCFQNKIKNLEDLRKHSKAIVNYYNKYCEKKIPKTSNLKKEILTLLKSD